MKIHIFKNPEILETEVIIRCNVMDAEVKAVFNFAQQYSIMLECEENKRKYRISVNDVYYIDTVDGKTFVYIENKVLCCRETLSYLEKLLENTSVTRISKNCLLNTTYLKCVWPYANHRMKAEILSGESLIISRKYMETLKRKIQILKGTEK